MKILISISLTLFMVFNSEAETITANLEKGRITNEAPVSLSISKVGFDHNGFAFSESVSISATAKVTPTSYEFESSGELSASGTGTARGLVNCTIDPVGYWSYVTENLLGFTVNNPYKSNEEKKFVFTVPMNFTGSYSRGGSGRIPQFKAYLSTENGQITWTKGGGGSGGGSLVYVKDGQPYSQSFVGTVSPGTYNINAGSAWLSLNGDLEPSKGHLNFRVNFTPAGTAEPSIGAVSELRGMVSVSRNGSTSHLGDGDAVYAGDIVETASSSFIKLMLDDGSQISLGQESRIRVEITRPQAPSVINLIKGWIRAKVIKDLEGDPNGKSKLFIKTNTAATGVRGTEFEVTYSEVEGEGTSQLNVIEGVVELIDYRLGRVTKVMAGQNGTVVGPVDNWYEEDDYEAIPTLAPEIVVFDQTSNEMTSGESSVDWGAVSIGTGGARKSFLIRNIWTSDLSDISFIVTGKNSTDFTITSAGVNVLLGGAATAFMITFDPSVTGIRVATLEIESNDANESPFVVSLTGRGDIGSDIFPYTTWQSGFFNSTQLANPTICGDLADFDNDGIPNLLEYLFGGNPTLPSSGLLPTITKAAGSSSLVFTYKRKIAATGVTQVIEHSANLSTTWGTAVHGQGGVTIITAAVPGDATAEQVIVTIPSASTNRFVRLKAFR